MRTIAFGLPTLTIAFFLFGCSTAEKQGLLERNVPVVVTVIADDAVLAGAISQESPRNFGKNISKHLTSGLEDRGILWESTAGPQSRLATLRVDLTGLQGESVFDVGPFGVSNKQVFKVSYTATFTSPDGRRQFRINGRESSRVLDELPAEIGRYIAKRVANHYRPAK